MKKCSKCSKEFPATIEYFYKDRRYYPDGLQSRCKKCVSAAGKKWREKPGIKILRKEHHKKYCSTIRGYLINCFSNIKKRCNNPKCHDYKYYGGRGIQCQFESFDDFMNYIINALKIDPRGLQIDRIDNDGNYEIGNIRFVTCKENLKNRRKWAK